MGVKSTCALFCLLGIAFLQIEATSTFNGANIRIQRSLNDIGDAESALAMNRRKRDVKDAANSQHSTSTSAFGIPGQGSFSSSSSSSSSSSGGGGSTYSSSGPGSSSVGSRSGFGATENVPYSGGVPYAGAPQNFAPSGNAGQSWSAPANQGQGFPGSDTQNVVRNVGSRPYYPDQNAALQAYAYNFQNFLQQYISALQAQAEQLRSQFPGPYQPGSGSWAHAAAFTTGPNGGVHPNTMVYTHVSTGESNGGTGHSRTSLSNQALGNQPRFGQNNRLENGPPFNNYPNNFGFGNRGQFGNDFGNFPSFNQRFPNSGFPSGFNHPQGSNFATAESAIGPQGGYQKGEIGPTSSPGVVSRFAEVLPGSSGGTYGAFSSSSSNSYQGPDGKVQSRKTATTWTNDNGKITTHTVHDP